VLIIIALVVGILLLGFGIVSLVALAAGGMSLDLRIFWGFVLVVVAIGVLAFFGRRRQKRAQAERADQIAARSR
jgi:membrane protein implicated in regulation of membrane protease activity